MGSDAAGDPREECGSPPQSSMDEDGHDGNLSDVPSDPEASPKFKRQPLGEAWAKSFGECAAEKPGRQDLIDALQASGNVFMLLTTK